jgi:hypothetical protein
LAEIVKKKEAEERARAQLEDLINKLHFEEEQKKLRDAKKAKEEAQAKARLEMLRANDYQLQLKAQRRQKEAEIEEENTRRMLQKFAEDEKAEKEGELRRQKQMAEFKAEVEGLAAYKRELYVPSQQPSRPSLHDCDPRLVQTRRSLMVVACGVPRPCLHVYLRAPLDPSPKPLLPLTLRMPTRPWAGLGRLQVRRAKGGGAGGVRALPGGGGQAPGDYRERAQAPVTGARRAAHGVLAQGHVAASRGPRDVGVRAHGTHTLATLSLISPR